MTNEKIKINKSVTSVNNPILQIMTNSLMQRMMIQTLKIESTKVTKQQLLKVSKVV